MRNQLDTDRSGKISFEEYAFRFGRKLQANANISKIKNSSCCVHPLRRMVDTRVHRWTLLAADVAAQILQRSPRSNPGAARWPPPPRSPRYIRQWTVHLKCSMPPSAHPGPVAAAAVTPAELAAWRPA
jgi:hypothetical protein